MDDCFRPAFAALTAIIDVLPKELQDKVIDQLKNMSIVCTDRGDEVSALFCRALSGEEYPQPGNKPLRLPPDWLRVVK
jgi:hypothetical protein